MADQEELDIRYSKGIKKVYRSKKGKSWLCWTDRECEPFDFVVWTPVMKRSLKSFHPAYEEEKEIFNKMRPVYFSTSLVNSLGVIRGPTPIDYWFDNVMKKREHSVWAQRDSYASVKGYEGPDYQNKVYPSGNDGKPLRTTVVYQYGKSRPDKQELHEILTSHLKNISASKVSIQQTKIWTYFPRFNPSPIRNGILWDILELQGRYGMWYAGSSVIFESVKSVVEYNMLLVSMMVPPSHKKRKKHKKGDDNEDDDDDYDEDDDNGTEETKRQRNYDDRRRDEDGDDDSDHSDDSDCESDDDD